MNEFSFVLFVILILLKSLLIGCQELNITFSPESIRGLSEWETRNVSFHIKLDDMNTSLDNEFELVLETIQSSEYPRQVMEISEQNTYLFSVSETEPTFSSQFKIKGLFLGYSNVLFNLYRNKSFVRTLDNYTVSVVRKTSKFDLFFGVIIISLVTINYVNMGCHLDLQVVKETIKKPIGPVIGFVCQFTVMPLASYLIGWLILDDIGLRLGLFTLGCSPGGNASNFWTLLFNGDVNLSVTMTFISTIAALVMMPFWLFTLGRTLFTTANIQIPYVNLISSLISLTFPMVIGIAIRHYKPNWAKVSQKIIKPFTIVVVILAIVGIAILYNHIFIMFTWPIVIAGALVAISGYSLGAITASLVGMQRSQIVAISIETAYQNGSIAFLLLLLSLQQPDADIASVPCFAQLLLTGQPLWLVFLGLKVYNCCTKTEQNNNETKDDKVVADKSKKVVINVIEANGSYIGPCDEQTSTDDKDHEHVKQVTKF